MPSITGEEPVMATIASRSTTHSEHTLVLHRIHGHETDAEWRDSRKLRTELSVSSKQNRPIQHVGRWGLQIVGHNMVIKKAPCRRAAAERSSVLGSSRNSYQARIEDFAKIS